MRSIKLILHLNLDDTHFVVIGIINQSAYVILDSSNDCYIGDEGYKYLSRGQRTNSNWLIEVCSKLLRYWLYTFYIDKMFRKDENMPNKEIVLIYIYLAYPKIPHNNCLYNHLRHQIRFLSLLMLFSSRKFSGIL